METQITGNLLDRYNDNDLSESEKRNFQLNLQSNPVLRKELELDIKLNQFLEDRETIELMEKISKLTQKPKMTFHRSVIYYLAAASVIFTLIMGITNLTLRNYKPRPVSGGQMVISGGMNTRSDHRREPFVVSRDRKYERTISVVQREMIGEALKAELFKPLKELELLVGARIRSSGVLINSPATDITTGIDSTVNFEWNSAYGADMISVVVVSNQGRTLLTFPDLKKDGKLHLCATNLGFGLFYWKFLVNDEIMMIGKITVR